MQRFSHKIHRNVNPKNIKTLADLQQQHQKITMISAVLSNIQH